MTSKHETPPLIRAFSRQVGNRPPFWFMRQAGRYLPEYQEVRRRAGSFLELCYTPKLAAEVTLQPVRRFGMDAAILFSDILVVPHALGQTVEFIETEGPRLAAVQSESDVAELSLERLHDRLAPVYETVERVAGQLAGTHTALIGFAGAPWTVAAYMITGGSSKDFAEARVFAYQQPHAFARLMALLVEATSRYLLRQISAGVHMVQLFESWSGLVPAEAFSDWVIEPTRRIVATLKAQAPGIPIVGFPRGAGLHTAVFAAEAGVDAVGLDQAVPLDTAHRLQERLPVQGNLDPALLLVGGEAMRRQTVRILKELAGRPFVFNLGHGILPATPPDHVAALSALIRDWPMAEEST